MNKGLYINHETKERECSGGCGILPFERFSSNGPKNGKKTMRAACRTCQSRVTYQRQMEKKLKLFPALYTQCSNEDCNYIYANSTTNQCKKCQERSATEMDNVV